MPTVSASLRRWFLTALIGSLVISAVVAIFILIFSGDFDDIEGKILFTTLSISFFSLTGLGSAAPLERGGRSPLAYLGLALAFGGFVFFLLGIWAGWADRENYGKSMGIVALFSFSFAQSAMLSLVKLRGTAQMLTPATILVIFALAGLATTLILREDMPTGYFRALAVLAVLDALGTITIPLVSRINPKESAPAAASQARRVEVRCPQCGTMQTLDEGGADCQKCSLRITVLTEA